MINIDNKYGYVVDEIERRGFSIVKVDNQWDYNIEDEGAIQEIIDSFDPLINARAEAIKRINEQSQSYMQSVEDEYPEFEKRTWSAQSAEANAWALDDTSLTPVLDAIALARGVDRLTIISKAYAKSLNYTNTAASLAGARQALESQIIESTDIDFICTVSFEA